MPKPKNSIPRPTLCQDKKTKIWFVSYTDPEKGYTKKRSTGTRDRSEAGQVLHTIGGGIVGTHVGLTPKNANYKIRDLLNAYKASKESVADTDERALKRLIEFFGAFTPDQLGDGAWKQYRKWRTSQEHVNASAQYQKVKKKVSDSTAIRELNVFRAAISWAQRSPHWKGLSHVRVTLPNAERAARQEFLSKDEARRLVGACVEPHQRLFVLLALATAARHRALLGLKWSQVTWPQGNEPKYGDHSFKSIPLEQLMPNASFTERGKSTRIVDFNKSTLKGAIRLDLGADNGNKRKPIAVISPSNTRLYGELLAAYQIRTTDNVIEWKKGGIGSKIDRVDLSDAYRRAGLKKPSAPQHVLKHTAISWMVQDGQEIAKISALTRTSIPTIEKVYGHLSPSHLEVVGDVLTLD